MSIIKFKMINDVNELIAEINDLERLARKYILQIEGLYTEDFFFISLIDKSIKLINSFLFALDEKNITVLAVLTRVQIDCAARAFAASLVEDSGEFCKGVIFEDKALNQLVDKNNKKLTDKHLCKELGKYLELPVYELYSKVCGFVHFSSISFYSIAKADQGNSINMLIGRNNREDDYETYMRLSIELANQFLFFGKVLIEELFASWLTQKTYFPKNTEDRTHT